MKTTINQLHEITGKDRRTIKRRLAALTPVKDGAAHFYESTEALPAIYAGEAARDENAAVTLIEARTRESLAKALKLEMEIEVIAKTRIPIEIINDAIEPVLALTKQIIMGSAMTEAQKKEICESLRDIPRNMKW